MFLYDTGFVGVQRAPDSRSLPWGESMQTAWGVSACRARTSVVGTGLPGVAVPTWTPEAESVWPGTQVFKERKRHMQRPRQEILVFADV